MTTSNLKQFLTGEAVPHYLIWYFISSETGKKTPLGEKNNEPIEKVNTAEVSPEAGHTPLIDDAREKVEMSTRSLRTQVTWHSPSL